jgi:Ca2+-binding RTX toxin-like protein
MALITGTSGTDQVNAVTVSSGVTGGPATAGDDTIDALGGADNLSGDMGNDLIDGGEGDDYLYGEFGDDTLIGGAGADHLYGGPANDLLSGGDGDDYLSDWAGQNTLIGGAGRDQLSVTNSGSGTALLDGGDGNDMLWVHGTAMTTMTGGGGVDRFVISGISDEPAGAAIGVVTDFETGGGGDILDVTSLLSTASGYAGGNPFSAGYMRLRQVGANTVLDWDYNGGGDNYAAALKFLNVRASAFTDANLSPAFSPRGTEASGHLITGTNGKDQVNPATVSGGVTGGAATAGDDTIHGLGGADYLSGGYGNDLIDGGEGGGILNGDQGDDTLVGGGDGDVLQGGSGHDSLWGGGGNDTLSGSSGVNTLRGGAGDDILTHVSTDTTWGSLLDGGDGDDVISLSGTAMTTMTGGSGADRFNLRGASYASGGAIVLTDFEAGAGGDILDFGDWLTYATGYEGDNPFGAGFLRLRQDGADAVLDWDRDGGGDGYVAALRLLGVQAAALTEANFAPGFNPDGSPLPGRLVTGTAAADTVSDITSSEGVTGGPATGGGDTINGLGGRDSLSGGVGDDLIDGGAENDRLAGDAGDDTLLGGDGADYVSGGVGDDLLLGGGGDDYLTGSWGSNTLLGGEGNDTLSSDGVGPAGADVLDGGDGADVLQVSRNAPATLTGGAGADLFSFNGLPYYSDGPAPFVVTDFEAGSGGDVLDVVSWLASSGGYTGGNPFEAGYLRLRQDGADALLSFDYNGGGDGYMPAIRLLNTQAAALTNANFKPGFAPMGAVIAGSRGADSIGMAGVSAGVTGGPPTDLGDTIDVGYGHDVVVAGAGADSIRGGDGADTLNAGAGNDTLDGGAGVDRLIGGTGDDLYVVTAGDVVVEGSNQGTDAVRTAISSYVLAANVENLAATNAIAHRFTGNVLDNVITGGAGADTLFGIAGNDTLDGGAGVDRLVGGLGNDLYLATAGDTVFEGFNQGIDTVRTTAATYVLAANVENLQAANGIAHRFTGNALDNAITGGAGADILLGGAGHDTLDGGSGIDRLYGGIGDDTFVVTAGDVIVEGANQGIDTVLVSHAGNYVLAANVENAVLSGGLATNVIGNAVANSETGNAAANVLYGMGGADTLSGEGGSDILIGGAGGDSLVGGSGNDQFRLGAATDSTLAAPDVIADFTFRRGIEMDRVDLRMIDANTLAAGNQAFAFRGAEFTGSAGDLRVRSAGEGSYIAAGDTNGDGAADFAITIRSEAAPEAAWFFL